MADIKLAPYVTLEQTGTGVVLANVLTPMGMFTATLGLNQLFSTVERSNDYGRGKKIYGLGTLRQLTGNEKLTSLYFYFYHTNGTGTLDSKGRLPDFINHVLTVNNADLIAYSCDASVVDSSKAKQGIQINPSGLFTTLSPIIGCTCYWPQNYGTGEINAMCVSLVDLTTLKTLSSSYALQQAVFVGSVQRYTSFNPSSYTDVKWVKPGITGITSAEEMLISFSDTERYIYNRTTGTYTSYTATYPYHSEMPMWGQNHFEIAEGRVLYIRGQYMMGNTSPVIGIGNFSTGVNESSTLYGDMYLAENQIIKQDSTHYLLLSSVSASTLKLKRLDITNFTVESATVDITLPTFITDTNRGSNAVLTCFEDGSYGLVDRYSGMCWKFTTLTNFESSITDVFFSGAAYGSVTPISNGANTEFVCITGSGYNNAKLEGGASRGNQCLAITDGRVGPVITWNKFDTIYNKKDTSELTSSFMITLSAIE